MKSLLNRIKNLIKIAKLLSVDDSLDIRFCNVSMLGKSSQKAMLITPYGLMHNPPENSLCVSWSQQAHESNAIVMADDPKNRILKNLTPGEVALGNYSTGDYIYFKENGEIDIVSSKKVNVAASSVQVTATSVDITSSTLKHNGVNISDTHVHGGIAVGGSNTLGPQ